MSLVGDFVALFSPDPSVFLSVFFVLAISCCLVAVRMLNEEQLRESPLIKALQRITESLHGITKSRDAATKRSLLLRSNWPALRRAATGSLAEVYWPRMTSLIF